MTRRITITLPDDIAERLDIEPNASKFIADALRARLRVERSWAALRAGGYIPTSQSRARARRKLDEARARVTPASRAESLRRLDELDAMA